MGKLCLYKKITCLIAVCSFAAACFGQYQIIYSYTDTVSTNQAVKLKEIFPTQKMAAEYINTFSKQMAAIGYYAASVDDLLITKDTAFVRCYLGDRYQFGFIKPSKPAQKILDAANIKWSTLANPAELQIKNDQILDYFENEGYPFATILLDSTTWAGGQFAAVLNIVPGALYKIDSIHINGGAKISNQFLIQYLKLPAGTTYNKQVLNQINKRLSELPFVQQSQPWWLNMQATGGIVNVYLEPKRNSQVNVLLGLAPANDQLLGNKLLLTGDANINLKNALGGGETIGFSWQQLQVKSPRINLQFQYPYVFKSAFGIDVGFELFKKDSLWVNVNAKAGILFDIGNKQSGKLFIQSLQTNISYTDTNAVRFSKKLPEVVDVSSVNIGIDYAFNSTNYRFNPQRGWDVGVQLTAGTKKLKSNNDILKLKDPSSPGFNYASLYDSVLGNTYQLRVKAAISKYFSLGKQAVFKTSLQAGWYQSPNVFKNELFQIGGYKLLRGFDEESIFSDLYQVLTAEFRYLLATNSYFFAFADGGNVHYKQGKTEFSKTYIGFGLGLAFETGNSLFNISYAVGKRNDFPLNFRQSKIHFGFVNFF